MDKELSMHVCRPPRLAVVATAAGCLASTVLLGVGTSAAGAGRSTLPPGAVGPAEYSALLYAVDSRTPKDSWAVGYTGDGSTDSTPIAEHWNGKTWRLTDVPGVEGATSTQLFGVSALSADDVWAVGSYSVDGVGTFALTEHWNGSKWSVVSTSNPPGSAVAGLNSVSAVSTDDVWAVGLAQDPSSGNFLAFSMHWDGTSWSVVQTASPDGTYWAPLRAVSAVATNDAWTVGEYEAGGYLTLGEHWDGTAWSITQTPNPKRAVVSSLYGVTASTSSDVWTAGCWSQDVLYCGIADSPQKPLLEHWNGTAWKLAKIRLPKGQAMGGFDAIGSASGQDVWAAGTSSADGTTAAPYVVRWNGKAWRRTMTPGLADPAPYIGGIDATSGKNAWLVGATIDGTLAEHWNGKKWKIVSTPNP
jgi:hypothetical protein